MLAGELTADVDQAALILRAHPVTVRELAASGALRGRKVGRCWDCSHKQPETAPKFSGAGPISV